ncbi:ATP synthase subunit f, mitochondrial-like [Apodemus sylvaticus]|uniref:ATP synthase subunit f, mitochondrial-like n=1 Tax=Apodemus sylvaticus TaxID=10129 RepID=UPI0022437D9A|nr:ATP synthase subunit f, mitochondrial-like [Apodemus sylvaticus]
MGLKPGELPSWILMMESAPVALPFRTFRRGHDQYYNKYINVQKGSIPGVNMVLAACVVFSYYISYKELRQER